MYSGIVTFVELHNMLWTATKLLKNIKHRRQLERKAVDFMSQQQRSNEPSSALNKLAAAMTRLQWTTTLPTVVDSNVYATDPCISSIEQKASG